MKQSEIKPQQALSRDEKVGIALRVLRFVATLISFVRSSKR